MRKHVMNRNCGAPFMNFILGGIALLLLIQTTNSFAGNYQRFNAKLVYQEGNIAVYANSRNPNTGDWCGSNRYEPANAKFEVVYLVDHDERDALFAPDFEHFVDTVMRPILAENCTSDPLSVDLDFYKRGDDEYLDKIKFRLRGENNVAAISRQQVVINKKHYSYQWRAAIESFGSCSDQPFCDLTGGIYLNAVYNNNATLIQKLDRQILEEVRNAPLTDAMNRFASMIFGEGTEAIGAEGISLLTLMSIKYMALYRGVHTSQSCLLEGATSITRKSDVDIVEFEDQSGNNQGAVDIGFHFTYVINKEFIPLCNKICSAGGASGAEFVANSLNSYKAKLVMNGMSKFLSKFECNDPQVKRFERNLISLTEQYLNDPPAWAALQPDNVTTSSNLATTNTVRTRTNISQTIPATIRAPTRMAVIPTPLAIDEKARSAAFLAENKTKDGVVVTPSGLQYIILAQGSGAHPTLDDLITVHETGTLVDGTVVDSNYARGGQPYMSPLRTVMKGWAEGLQLIKSGGKIRLFIPAELAYGDRNVGTIKAGAALIYEIELISIN